MLGKDAEIKARLGETVYEIVPKVVWCSNCGARMRPTSTPRLVRWFRCAGCGETRKLHRRWFDVPVRRAGSPRP